MKKIRSIHFMFEGRIHSVCGNAIGDSEGFFKRFRHVNYPEFEVNQTISRYWDAYFETWFGGYVASDQIWARSREEASMINSYLINHP